MGAARRYWRVTGKYACASACMSNKSEWRASARGRRRVGRGSVRRRVAATPRLGRGSDRRRVAATPRPGRIGRAFGSGSSRRRSGHRTYKDDPTKTCAHVAKDPKTRCNKMGHDTGGSQNFRCLRDVLFSSAKRAFLARVWTPQATTASSRPRPARPPAAAPWPRDSSCSSGVSTRKRARRPSVRFGSRRRRGKNTRMVRGPRRLCLAIMCLADDPRRGRGVDATAHQDGCP